MNGRVLGDSFGKFTCFSPSANRPSVIDYFCITASDLHNVIIFKVMEPIPHSIHCIISATLRTGTFFPLDEDEIPSKPCETFFWSNGSDERFSTVLRSPEMTTKL